MFHPVPPDDTHRIGAAGLLYTSASVTAEAPLPGIPGIPDLGPASVASPSFLDQMEPQITNDDSRVITKVRPQPHSEKTYFGLSRQCRLLSDLVSSPPQPSQVETKWSNVEPFRFSVEFWDVQNLIERERTYSTTHFFGGNWFNVYVQTIRRKEKGLQLGVYLHRQSPGEPFPVPSSPGGQATAATAASVSGVGGLTGGAPLDRTTTAHATVGSPRAGEGASPYEDLDEEVKKKEAYRDNRPITKVSRVSSHLERSIVHINHDAVLILAIGLFLNIVRFSPRNGPHPILFRARQLQLVAIMGLEIECITIRRIPQWRRGYGSLPT